eukprot:12926224-Prorocentrum_lima.AAC.1
MATALLLSKLHPRSTGKKARSEPPPKKKYANNQDGVLYLYICVLTQEQENMIAIFTAVTMLQENHLSTGSLHITSDS